MLALLFGVSGRIDRRTYLAYGVPLAAIKYGVDALVVRAVTGRVWTPLDYLNPLLSAREQALGPQPTGLLIAMALWALPFLWVGVSLSLRRALDAGLSPWHVVWFFVPLANWILIALLCAAPSRPPARLPPAEASDPEERIRGALLGILVGVALIGVTVGLQVLLFKRYSAPLFLGTPFTVGLAAGFFYNRRAPRGPKETYAVAMLAVTLGAASVLLFALEGVICVAMALPLALVAAVLGAEAGRFVALHGPSGWMPPAVLFAAFPLAGALPAPAPVEHEVVSAVEVDAPPERVWQHVVAFSELPEPPSWLFRLGVAYPMRARIEGHGVGAVRRCEFSTGAFVEPITVWDEPRRLSFDVAAQPPPMTELSPYRHVHPPHLDGTMRSRHGEFRLTALPGGRTRLEGSTWYTLEIGPEPYWRPMAELVVHAIHMRVLRHVKALAEAG